LGAHANQSDVGRTQRFASQSAGFSFPRERLRNNTNVVFLHTTVDDGDHFQQILAWTLRSRWQQQNGQLREITGSFRSEK
jgi:hypothetical protein